MFQCLLETIVKDTQQFPVLGPFEMLVVVLEPYVQEQAWPEKAEAPSFQFADGDGGEDAFSPGCVDGVVEGGGVDEASEGREIWHRE